MPPPFDWVEVGPPVAVVGVVGALGVVAALVEDEPLLPQPAAASASAVTPVATSPVVVLVLTSTPSFLSSPLGIRAQPAQTFTRPRGAWRRADAKLSCFAQEGMSAGSFIRSVVPVVFAACLWPAPSARATTVGVTAAKRAIAYGQSTMLVGKVTNGGDPVANAKVLVSAAPYPYRDRPVGKPPLKAASRRTGLGT